MGNDNTTNNNYNKQEVRKKLKNESKYKIIYCYYL